MKKKYMRKLLILPTIFLTSCGYSLTYLVKGNTYNSPIFQDNYYRHWDEELKSAKAGNSYDVDPISSFDDLFTIDPNVYGKYESSSEYGRAYKMNLVDDMFNYGVQSKLFDGQMVCGAQDGHPERAYALARVQADKEGFSVRFSKESAELNYFALQLKATTDNTVDVYKVNSEEKAQGDRDQYHNSLLHLNVNLYVKEDSDIVGHTFKMDVNIDKNRTNNGSEYFFLAFDLKQYNLSRLIGVSFTYTVEDELIEWNKKKGIDVDYAVFLYEFFLPYTTWQ